MNWINVQCCIHFRVTCSNKDRAEGQRTRCETPQEVLPPSHCRLASLLIGFILLPTVCEYMCVYLYVFLPSRNLLTVCFWLWSVLSENLLFLYCESRCNLICWERKKKHFVAICLTAEVNLSFWKGLETRGGEGCVGIHDSVTWHYLILRFYLWTSPKREFHMKSLSLRCHLLPVNLLLSVTLQMLTMFDTKPDLLEIMYTWVEGLFMCIHICRLILTHMYSFKTSV